MSSTWKKEQGKTIRIALVLLALLSFLIYWQGNVSVTSFFDSLLSLFLLDLASIPSPYNSLLLDVGILLGGGILTFAFFAHFVIPLQSKGQFVEVMKVMVQALSGKKPRVINLRNGIEINREGPLSNLDASIILLDISSAAVLRNKQAFSRAIGPGIHLIDDQEKIAGSLDLRIHRRSIGPLPGEDPYAENAKSEDPAIKLARKNRRGESVGLSKDGVEIIPRIEIRFKIEGEQAKQGSPFPFHPEFAWRAIANEAVSPNQPSDVRNRQIHWDWLPAQLAGDMWRVFLKKYTLQELFEEVKGGNFGESREGGNISGLQKIELLINKRLTSPLVEGKDGKNSSPEYQLLRNRGVKVINVRIRDLYVDPRKEELRLINEWSENWEMEAIQEDILSNEIREQKKSEGIQLGAKKFVQMVSEDLLQRLSITDGEKIMPPSEKQSLSLLLKGTLRNAKSFSKMNQSLHERLEEMQALFFEGDSNES